MSEKRFSWKTEQRSVGEIQVIIDNKEKKVYANCFSICDLLNELSDENNILNKNEDDLKECTIENIKLREENEQLKKELKWKREEIKALIEESERDE